MQNKNKVKATESEESRVWSRVGQVILWTAKARLECLEDV